MNISCDVILDLIPLVKDNVASKDSIELVSNHLKSCEECRIAFKDFKLQTQTDINDKKVMASIKKKLLFLTSALLLIGATIGMVLNKPSNIVPAIFIVIGILLIGTIIFRVDFRGDGRMNRFFMGRAIGTIVIFALLGIYLLLKYVLHLF